MNDDSALQVLLATMLSRVWVTLAEWLWNHRGSHQGSFFVFKFSLCWLPLRPYMGRSCNNLRMVMDFSNSVWFSSHHDAGQCRISEIFLSDVRRKSNESLYKKKSMTYLCRFWRNCIHWYGPHILVSTCTWKCCLKNNHTQLFSRMSSGYRQHFSTSDCRHSEELEHLLVHGFGFAFDGTQSYCLLD